MAFEQQILDLPVRNSQASGSIPQFAVVCWDSANVNGVVLPGQAGAGPVAGINLSRDVDPNTGALLAATTGVNPGSSIQLRALGISRVTATAVATIISAPLYALSTVNPGFVANSRPAAGADVAGNFVGYGLEASAGVLGDIVSVLVMPGMAPAFKRLTGSITAGQVSVPHGLPYVPQTVIIKPKANATFWESQVADATNVYLTSSSAGPNAADVFVA